MDLSIGTSPDVPTNPRILDACKDLAEPFPGVLEACQPLSGQLQRVSPAPQADVVRPSARVSFLRGLKSTVRLCPRSEHKEFLGQLHQHWNSVLAAFHEKTQKAEETAHSWHQLMSSQLGGVVDKSTKLCLLMQQMQEKLTHLEEQQSKVVDAVRVTNIVKTEGSPGENGQVLSALANQNIEKQLSDMQESHSARLDAIMDLCVTNSEQAMRLQETLVDKPETNTAEAVKDLCLAGRTRSDSLCSAPPMMVSSAPSSKCIVGSDVTAYLQLRGWTGKTPPRRSTRMLNELAKPVADCLRLIELASVVLVLLNLLFMGVSLDIELRYAMKHETAPASLWFIDLAFMLLFALECSLRLALQRRLFLHSWWNGLDVLVIVVHCIDVVSQELVTLNFLRVLRYLRIFRAARLLRYFDRTRQVRLVLCSLSNMIRPLLMLFTLTVVTLYLCSLMLAQLAHRYITLLPNGEQRDQYLRFYGSVLDTMWTLFMAVSGGVDWIIVWHPFEEQSSSYRILFGVVASFFTHCIYNLVTAVFVDAVIWFATLERDALVDDLASRRGSPLQIIRSLLQEDCMDDIIPRKKMNKLLSDDEKAAAAMDELGMNVQELNGLAKLLDANDTGHVSIDELVLAIMQLKGSANPVATMMYTHKQVAMKLSGFHQMVDKGLDKLFCFLSTRASGVMSHQSSYGAMARNI